MKTVAVVGSGPSALHFAQTALARGWRVSMVDVGRERPLPVRPGDSFLELKKNLPDPAAYFLGRRFESVLFPGEAGEYYGFPPHRLYLFEGVPPFRVAASGFDPLYSFAQGGLAEAWTGGCFPFNQAELASFPFGWSELEPHYDEVARRIGICGAEDDLARFVPVHAHLSEPLDLDEHGAGLLARYEKAKSALNQGLRVWIGRTRAAVLRDGQGERQGCTLLGRCLWGCPRDALYTPFQTLQALRSHPDFSYRSGLYASHLELDGSGRPRGLAVQRLADGGVERIEAERYVLGAGTLSSSRILMETLRLAGVSAPRLEGLMDNRQVLVPFVNLSRIGRAWRADSYQYHQLALGLEGERPEEYVHGLVTTLKTALIHPIVQGLPFDLATSTWVFKNLHAALGLVNVNLHDTRRASNALELEPDASGGPARLHVTYAPPADERARLGGILRRLRKALWKLGCIVPPGMAHQRPMGASVHYAGTVPMARNGGALTTTPQCESRAVPGLFLVDGSTFPFLPAKNLTFTLMANATRVATDSF